jgi:hypothetical protein
MRELNWASFKQVITGEHAAPFSFTEEADCFWIFAAKAGWQFSCQLPFGSEEAQDFVDNFQSGAV